MLTALGGGAQHVLTALVGGVDGVLTALDGGVGVDGVLMEC